MRTFTMTIGNAKVEVDLAGWGYYRSDRQTFDLVERWTAKRLLDRYCDVWDGEWPHNGKGAKIAEFQALPKYVRAAMVAEWHSKYEWESDEEYVRRMS